MVRVSERREGSTTYSWKLFPGESFRQFYHPLSLVKILSVNFFSTVKDRIADNIVAIFTALVKILSLKKKLKDSGA